MLGFSMLDNFRFPYAAIGFSDFWRRWHISLSTWLRDYLYIPLGGNRKGEVRTYVNLLVTMLLGGLWHGASWTFVSWGGLHGLYLSGERVLRARLGHLTMWGTWPARLALGILTYALVCLTWVFFRARDFGGAARLLRSMLLIDRTEDRCWATGSCSRPAWVSAGSWQRTGTCGSASCTPRCRGSRRSWRDWCGVAMLFLVAITQGDSNAFIYFQF